MHELFQFFIRNSKWFVFAIYVVLSCMLLFTFNPYQHHVWLTSAGQVEGAVYGASNYVTSYFNLRENNEDLNRRNVTLQNEVLELREQLQALRERHADSADVMPMARHFDFIVGHVINNSVMRPYNYVTINKGSEDGVAPEMGVIDQNGVVGIVNVVSPHYCRVLSLLNPHFRLSCKIKGDESFGSLVWDGKDPRFAVLEELPRHTVCHKGDTVVTSGYSAVFPSGLPVGVVEGNNASENDNFFSLKVRLLSDFTTLNNVQIIRNNNIEEIRRLDAENEKTEGNDLDLG